MPENTREWIGFTAPGEGKIYDIEYPAKGWEFSNFIADGNMTGLSRGFKAFPDP